MPVRTCEILTSRVPPLTAYRTGLRAQTRAHSEDRPRGQVRTVACRMSPCITSTIKLTLTSRQCEIPCVLTRVITSKPKRERLPSALHTGRAPKRQAEAPRRVVVSWTPGDGRGEGRDHTAITAMRKPRGNAGQPSAYSKAGESAGHQPDAYGNQAIERRESRRVVRQLELGDEGESVLYGEALILDGVDLHISLRC